MTTPQKIAEAVQAHRKLHGFTPVQMAKGTGLHENTIRKLERGTQRDISLRVVMLVAAALDVKISVLTGDRWQ